MEKRTKLYLLRFGNSPVYRVEYEVPEDATPLHKPNPFAELEAQLTEYLLRNNPMAPVAYFTTPRVNEISQRNRGRWEQYPPLDDEAIKAIEEELRKEVSEVQSTAELNSNAPWSDV